MTKDSFKKTIIISVPWEHGSRESNYSRDHFGYQKTHIVILFCIKVSDLSSINDTGENGFAYEESNMVGISEITPEEKDKKLLGSIKKKSEK